MCWMSQPRLDQNVWDAVTDNNREINVFVIESSSQTITVSVSC